MMPALDLFSGIGGWTSGAKRTASVRVRVALNHDPDAIAWHQAAHPDVRHLLQDAAGRLIGNAIPVELAEGVLRQAA